MRSWLLVGLLGCGPKPVVEQRPPDIFLFTVDTLRADHLPIDGYERDTAPWLSSVAAKGVVFERASSSSSWTVPGVASFLTGMLPHQLGISDVPSKVTVSGEISRIPDTAITLAERLKDQGYTTYGVTSNAHLTPEMGYTQGFDHYVNVGFKPADAVQDALEPFVADIANRTQPVFVWIHLFDPHDPYMVRKPWVEEWATSQAGLAALGQLPMRDLTAHPDLARDGLALPQLVALYDGEIAYSDRALKQIASDLKVADDDLLIVTSDHGEEFRDHGNLGHRVTLFEETVRVPLVVSWPDRYPPSRHSERVSIVEIAPTVAEVVGAPVGPYSGVSTRSLVPLLSGGERGVGPAVVADLTRANGPRLRAIYQEDRKLILVGDPVERTLLYDLSNDPGERADLSANRPKQVAEMRKALRTRMRSAVPLARQNMEGEIPDDVLEQLKAMGYVDEEEAPED